MPPILDAVRARATLGEISDALREVWGVYRPHELARHALGSSMTSATPRREPRMPRVSVAAFSGLLWSVLRT